MKRTINIGHATAMHIWHVRRLQEARRRTGSWIGTEIFNPFSEMHEWSNSGDTTMTKSDCETLRSELDLPDAPIHVVVESEARRTRTDGFVNHILQPDNLPTGALLSVRPGLAIASPELLFLNMARILALEDLIEFGYMICGTYTFSFNQEGRSVGCPPLTSTTLLARFIEESSAVCGIAKARRALRFIRNGSNSPRETQTTLMLCLPPRLHGMSCPFPELNAALHIGDTVVHPDFYWRQQAVVGEYNGGQHGGIEQMLRDARRSNDFTVASLKMFNVTNEHLSDTKELIGLGELVRGLLGLRPRIWTPQECLGIDQLRNRYTNPNRIDKWRRLYLEGVWE